MNLPIDRQDPYESENALPTEKVRMVNIMTYLLSDGKEISIHGTLTPFQQKPNLEVAIRDKDGRVWRKIGITDVANPALDYSIKAPEDEGSYHLVLTLSSPAGEMLDQADIPLEFKKKPARILRRGGAFLIDMLILAVICIGIGLLFGDLLISLGAYARLVSAAIGLLFFGFFNSNHGHGRTPGKRLLHLSVEDLADENTGFRRALLRSIPVVAVLLFVGWQLPIFSTSNVLPTLVEDLFIYGLGFAIAFLLIVSQKNGQSLHDVLAGTRVLDDRHFQDGAYPETSRKQKIIAVVGGVILALVIWGSGLAASQKIVSPPQKIMAFYQALSQDHRFLQVGVSDRQQLTVGYRTARLLVISLFLRDNLDDIARRNLSQEVVALAPKYVNLTDYNGIFVVGVRGYDLGFYSRQTTWVYASPGNFLQYSVVNTILGFSITTNYSLK